MENQYNASAAQVINLEINKNGKKYRVSHKLGRLEAERYFKFADDLEKIGSTSTFSTAVYEPKRKLWLDLVEERTGYAERGDWKEKTHINDCVQAVNGLLFVDLVIESAPTDELLSDEELTAVKIRSVSNGEEVETVHYFNEESKEQFDEYWAILNNQPQKNVLASGLKKNAAQRFSELYKTTINNAQGYIDNVVPVWHEVFAVKSFFEMQLSRLGKF